MPFSGQTDCSLNLCLKCIEKKYTWYSDNRRCRCKYFFKNKEIQSEDIAAWTDGTKRRLRSIYFNYLTDANLLTVVDKKKTITPPILDIALERYLEACGESVIIKAITGVD